MKKFQWELFTIGLITAALFIPFNTLSSSCEGILGSGEMLLNRYFYQITIIAGGFGASVAFFLTSKFDTCFKWICSYLALLPIALYLFITVFFNYFMVTNLASEQILIFVYQILIAIWYFFQGSTVSLMIKKSSQLRESWLAHLAGLFLGYLLSYLFITKYGILGVLISCIFLVLWIMFRKMYFIYIIPFLLFCVAYFSNNFQDFSINQYFNNSNDSYINRNEDIDKRSAYKIQLLDERSKIIFSKWSPRGLTEVIQKNSNYISLFINKYHIFSYKKGEQVNYDRAFIYNTLFDEKNTKAIIGVGGLRSLTYVDPNKFNHLNAIEVNNDTIEYVKNSNLLYSDIATRVNYLNLDGRFFIDTLPANSLDILIYEGSTVRMQSIMNEYIKPNYLANKDAIINAAKKLKADGFFIFETTFMASRTLKKFQHYKMLKTIESVGFNVRTIANTNISNFYIIANRNLEKLSIVDKILNDNIAFSEVNNYAFENRFNSCDSIYDDDFPFYNLTCFSELWQFSTLPVYFSLILFVIIYLFSIRFVLKKIEPADQYFALAMLQLGLLQSTSFSLLQFKFDSYLFDDNFTNLILILGCISASLIGTYAFSSKSKTLKITNANLISFIILSIGVSLFKFYLIESIVLRFLVFILIILISNLYIGGIFASYLSMIKKDNIGNVLLLDSVGLFLGYLSNYFILRTFGVFYFTLFIAFLGFIYLLMTNLYFKKVKSFN